MNWIEYCAALRNPTLKGFRLQLITATVFITILTIFELKTDNSFEIIQY